MLIASAVSQSESRRGHRNRREWVPEIMRENAEKSIPVLVELGGVSADRIGQRFIDDLVEPG
jgi:hypothetical protein